MELVPLGQDGTTTTTTTTTRPTPVEEGEAESADVAAPPEGFDRGRRRGGDGNLPTFCTRWPLCA